MVIFETGQLIYIDPTSTPVLRVYQNKTYRWLMFSDEAVQSAQWLAKPNHLALDYLQAMMSFLLFNPSPKRVIQCGLGGGALVRFIAHHWPDATQTVIEQHPSIIELAREQFGLPEQNKLNIITADAKQEIQQLPANSCDTLLIDIYDCDNPDANLDENFFQASRAVLTEQGVAVLNTLPHHPELFTQLLKAIRNAFAGQTLCLNVPEHDNIIILAFAQAQPLFAQKGGKEQIEQRAKMLSQTFKLPFYDFWQRLRLYNRHILETKQK